MNNSNFFIGINIKCEPKKFEELLNKYQINYKNMEIKNVKFLYDDLTFLFFQSPLTRKELIYKLKLHSEILNEIIEFSFYKEIN